VMPAVANRRSTDAIGRADRRGCRSRRRRFLRALSTPRPPGKAPALWAGPLPRRSVPRNRWDRPDSMGRRATAKAHPRNPEPGNPATRARVSHMMRLPPLHVLRSADRGAKAGGSCSRPPGGGRCSSPGGTDLLPIMKRRPAGCRPTLIGLRRIDELRQMSDPSTTPRGQGGLTIGGRRDVEARSVRDSPRARVSRRALAGRHRRWRRRTCATWAPLGGNLCLGHTLQLLRPETTSGAKADRPSA